MTTVTKRTPEEIRDDRNARRRAKRLADTRLALARHAASYLLHWENDGTRPITTRKVIDQTRYMHFNHREIQRQAITTDEAQTALDAVRQAIRDEEARRTHHA